MSRSVLSGVQMHLLTVLSATALDFYLVHAWLGYPLVPATQTNEFWALVWLNLQIVFWAGLLAIPSLLAVVLVMAVIDGIVWLLSLTYYEVKA